VEIDNLDHVSHGFLNDLDVARRMGHACLGKCLAYINADFLKDLDGDIGPRTIKKKRLSSSGVTAERDEFDADDTAPRISDQTDGAASRAGNIAGDQRRVTPHWVLALAQGSADVG
jgi:hypothetical protein